MAVGGVGGTNSEDGGDWGYGVHSRLSMEDLEVRSTGSPELELQAVVCQLTWVLGTIARSSATAVQAFDS